MLPVSGFEWVRLLTASLNESISDSNGMLGGSLFHWAMARGKKEYL